MIILKILTLLEAGTMHLLTLVKDEMVSVDLTQVEMVEKMLL